MKNILILSIVFFLTNDILHCQTSILNTEVTREERTLKITSNIDNVKVRFVKSGNYNQNLGTLTNKELTYTFNTISGKQTTLELYGDHVETKKIKIYRYLKNSINPFSPESYAIAYKSRTLNVEMNYTKAYMEKEYIKIEQSNNPSVFEDYIKTFPLSAYKSFAVNKKDSLELKIAVGKRSEKAMDEYISSHSSSKFLNDAKKIKNDFAVARTEFAKAKQNSSSESMEKFINDYPNALEYNEANKIFVDRAFKETLEKNTIKDALSFTDNVLYQKKQYIDAANFENYKLRIQEAVDQLIVTNAEKDKSYETLKSCWSEYQDIQSKYYEKLGSFNKCFSLQYDIYTMLYSNLLNKKTENEQTAFLNNAKLDFKDLGSCGGSNEKIDIIGCIMFNAKKPDGTIKLFNQQFLKKRFGWQGDLHYLLFYNDKDVSAWDVDYEELTFKENREVKLEAFKAKKPVLKAKFDNCDHGGRCAYEASFYNNGNLVRTQVSDKNEKMYYYDFENGVNISLKNLDNKINEADKALAANDFDKALNILNNDCKNNYPSSVAQNIRISNTLSKVNQAKNAYLKKQEEIRLAEEKRREEVRLAEERKQEAIRIAEEQRKVQELKERYKPIVVDPVDFLDNRGAYVGKTLRFLVTYGNSNGSWPNTKESTQTGGQYFDYVCRCMKDDPYKSKTFKSENYKVFEFVDGPAGTSVTVNVPDEFFNNGKMNNSFKDGYLVIDFYVEGASRWQDLKLIDIFRYKR